MTILVMSIMEAGNSDRSELKVFVARRIHYGVTGKISFDITGSRLGVPELAKIDKGRLIRDGEIK